MSEVALARVAKALAAMKQADLAAVSGNRSAAAALRRKAGVLRSAAARDRAPTDISDLKAQALFQAQSDRRARDALAAAADLDVKVIPLMEKLAITIGREQALGKVIEAAQREARRKADLKAEIEAFGVTAARRNTHSFDPGGSSEGTA